jgi:hypothetical protein
LWHHICPHPPLPHDPHGCSCFDLGVESSLGWNNHHHQSQIFILDPEIAGHGFDTFCAQKLGTSEIVKMDHLIELCFQIILAAVFSGLGSFCCSIHDFKIS